MIIHGGYAAKLNGFSLNREPSDIDIYGSDAELERLREELSDRVIVTETTPNKYSIVATSYKEVQKGWKNIEFEVVPSELYRVLHELGDGHSQMFFGIPVVVASMNTVRMIKESVLNHADHVNPKHEEDLKMIETAFDDFKITFNNHLIKTNTC
jgi:hypothetical protein